MPPIITTSFRKDKLGKRVLSVGFAMSLTLVGCSTAPVQPVSSAPSAAVAGANDGLPVLDLTGDLLNDLLLADIAARRGHTDIAVNIYSRLARETQDPRLAERATRSAYFIRDTKEALRSAELWISLDPENLEARQMATALYIRAEQPDLALGHIEKILTSSQASNENGFMVIAGLLSREKDKRAALDLMRRFTEKRQDNADALYAYGNLAARLGEWKIAEETTDRVLTLRPNWDEAIVQKSQILRAQGKTAQTVVFLQQAVTARPESVDLRLVFARLLADEERLPEAYEQFVEINRLRPDNDDALFALGFLALELDRLPEAEKYLMALKERGARGDEVDYYLGRLEEARGNIAKAAKWYNAVGEGDHYINAQIRIVVIKSQEKDLAGARALLDSLRVQRPGQKMRLFLVEGEILNEAERYQDAYDLYNKALDEFVDNGELLYARAMTAEKLNKLDVLEQDLRKVLARNPNNAEALNALGYTLADRTNRYEEALDFVKRALELRPTDFYIVDSLGWVYYRLGNYDEAVKYLRHAFELKMDPDVAAHLGEVLWVKGDKDEARKVWQQALDVNQKGKKKAITEAMRRLNVK